MVEQRWRGSSSKSGELEPALLVLAASLEVEEDVQVLGQGNAGAEGLVGMVQSFAGDGGGGGAVEGVCPHARTGSRVFIGVGASVGANLLRLGRNTWPRKVETGAAGEVVVLGSWRPAWRLERASGPCPREERPRGRTGGTGGVPRIHLAVDESWTRSTGAYGRAAAEQRGEREHGLVCEFQKFRGLSII
jgi:hypothetical protein